MSKTSRWGKKRAASITLVTCAGALSLGATLAPSPTPSKNFLHQKDGFIQVTPFGVTPIDQATMAQNITTLLQNAEACKTSPSTCVDPKNVVAIQQQATQFKKSMQDIVNEQLSGPAHGKIPYHDEWYDDGPLGLSSHEYHKITFQSLIQRPFAHPSNTVTIQYVLPSQQASCPVDYKTAIITNGATDSTVAGLSEMATYISKMNNIATAFMTLPQFGIRRLFPSGHADPKASHLEYDPDEFNSDFLDTEDRKATDENVKQAILDLHLTIDWINSIKKTAGPSTISLSGLSLGSLIELLYEGIEPGRITGGDTFYAAGVDIAHAIFSGYMNAPRYEDDYYRNLIKSQQWSTDAGRTAWAWFDPLTWLGQIKGRDMLLVNAKYDELFEKQFSYDPMVKILKANNKVEVKWTDTGHNPTLGKSAVYEALHVFMPIMDYLRANGVTSDPNQCNVASP